MAGRKWPISTDEMDDLGQELWLTFEGLGTLEEVEAATQELNTRGSLEFGGLWLKITQATAGVFHHVLGDNHQRRYVKALLHHQAVLTAYEVCLTVQA